MKANIPGYDDYHITKDGRLFSKKSGKWVQRKWTIGDKRVQYRRYAPLFKDGHLKQFKRSQLMALVYIPNPENKPCVCHKDNDPTNDSISNLYWGTYSENIQQMVRDGRCNNKKGINNPFSITRIGEGNPNSKISDNDRGKIVLLYKTGKYTQASLAVMFGISRRRVGQILKGN